MVKTLFSQREFCRRVGVSPQRLKELISKGQIHVNEAGMVSMKEYMFFIQEKLIKEMERDGKSYLLIAINRPDEEIVTLRNDFVDEIEREIKKTPVEVESIDNLIKLVIDEGNMRDITEETQKNMVKLASKQILYALVERVQAAAFRIINRFADTKEIGVLSLKGIYELLMYDKIYSGYNEDEYRRILSTPVDPVDSTTISVGGGYFTPLVNMEDSFRDIVKSLGFVDKDGEPIVNRADFTPDMVNKVLGMDMRNNIIPTDPTINKIISVGIKSVVNGGNRSVGSESHKILERAMVKTTTINQKTKIYSLTRGFYTVFGLDGNTTRSRAEALAKDIIQGYYKRIVIVSDPEDYDNYMPDFLKIAINGVTVNRKAHLDIHYTE